MRVKPVLGGVLAAILFSTSATVAGDRPLTLVELFTSQGCSSCPPADELMGELAGRDDVLPLSFNVDYWDYIGWKDPFAKPAHTDRQRTYAKIMGLGYVYTPQVVINGTRQEVGSRRDSIMSLIAAADEDSTGRSVLSLKADGKMLRIAVEAGQAPAGGALIHMAVYDLRHETRVGRGENQGRVLANFNVVRSFETVGEWRGESVEIAVPIEALKGDGVAVFLQDSGQGPVLGAAAYELTGR